MKAWLAWLTLVLIPANLSASDELADLDNSLFDQLFAGPQYQIPYPFEALLDYLRSRLYAGDGEQALAIILIPRGRSLQRDAASPEFYRYPRIVVALDRESEQAGLIKNRLFLGYQERAQSIEVISYNEYAGRFEFQVIEDYAPNKTPRVRRADRRLCLSCHQNAAAIFARPFWQETNFNAEVAARIGEIHPTYQGISTDARFADADRFDFATDQANLLRSYQQVWRQGCQVSDDTTRNRKCRASLFLAALQRVLAGATDSPYQPMPAELKLHSMLNHHWTNRWPEGLPVASGDIDDRPSPAGEIEDRVPPQLNPLTIRPPLTYWSYQAAARRTIEGIGDQFLLNRDLHRLRQISTRKSFDLDQLQIAIQRMLDDRQDATLFDPGPIPGVALMQALLNRLDRL